MRLDKPRVAPLSDAEIDPEVRERIGAGPTGTGTGPILNIFRTLAHHPGLARRKGYIGFLGHGSRVEFRNLRVKELSETTASAR